MNHIFVNEQIFLLPIYNKMFRFAIARSKLI